MQTRDIKTNAIVLKRTNFGETDRILTILTPLGRKSALAKGVRKERSKLAGAVEPFSLTEVNLHEGKGELLVVTSAKCKKFYSNLLKDFTRLEVASEILKKVMRASNMADSPEYFELLKQCLEELNNGADVEMVLTWFYLNLAKVNGEDINLHFDTNGEVLRKDGRYAWDTTEAALKNDPAGKISENEIKMLRLMVSAKLSLVLKVKNVREMVPELLFIAKALNQL